MTFLLLAYLGCGVLSMLLVLLFELALGNKLSLKIDCLSALGLLTLVCLVLGPVGLGIIVCQLSEDERLK